MTARAPEIDDGGGADSAPDRGEPHIGEHEHDPGRIAGVHLLDGELNVRFNFDEGGGPELTLRDPHDTSSSASPHEALIAVGFGATLNFMRFTISANIGIYATYNADPKIGEAGFRIAPFVSLGWPGGVTQKGGVGFDASVGPNIAFGYGDSDAGFLGGADNTGYSGPGLTVQIVKTPTYTSATFSDGAGLGFSYEHTKTESLGEFNSFDVQNCVRQLENYIRRAATD